MEQKTFKAQMKLADDGEPGAFRAVFSTLGVIDLDGDVTIPGAFKQGAPVLIEGWNHDWGLPVGKGAIQADDSEAWVDGEFLLSTAGGKEHYETIKALGSVEWSYTFNVESASFGERDGRPVRYLEKLDVLGVGPVTRGAGIDTRLVAIKTGNAASGVGAPTPDEDLDEDPAESGAPGLTELIGELAEMLEAELGIEAD